MSCCILWLNIFSVLACRCNRLGTVNNTIQCDQYTGACPCRISVQGRYCDVCKDGFYFFPINLGQDCLQCPCDLGGAFPQCNKVTGEKMYIFMSSVVSVSLHWPAIFGQGKQNNKV